MTAYMFVLTLYLTYGQPIKLGVYQDYKKCEIARDAVRLAVPAVDRRLYYQKTECMMEKYADETYE